MFAFKNASCLMLFNFYSHGILYLFYAMRNEWSSFDFVLS